LFGLAKIEEKVKIFEEKAGTDEVVRGAEGGVPIVTEF